MSTTIDPHNTTQWQQTGNSIYLLEENDRSTANAFSVTVVKYHSSNNQTDPKEIASKICSFLNNESVGVDPKVRLEMVFQSDGGTLIWMRRRGVDERPGEDLGERLATLLRVVGDDGELDGVGGHKTSFSARLRGWPESSVLGQAKLELPRGSSRGRVGYVGHARTSEF